MPVDPIVTKRFIEALSTQLEDHLASWKSSLADAKRDIENTLNAMSEKIPAQARPLFPEDLMGMILEDVLPPPVEKVVERVVEKVVEKPVPAPAAAVPSAPDWSVVRSAVASIEAARTQVDVLTRFLGQAQAHASRVALLVLRNDRLTGWKALGFDATGGRDEAIKAIDLPAHEDPFAGEALSRERSIVAEPADEAGPLRRALGGTAPARTLLVPMVIRDRIAGLLCADELPGDDGRLNEAALETLTFVTGLCVDLLAARKRIPSPTLTPLGEPLARFGRPVPEVIEDAGATVRAMPAIELPPPPAATGAHAVPAPSPRPAPAPAEAEGRRRITDASEALRALEESAAARKKPEPEPHAEPPRVEAPRAPEPPRPAPRPAPAMEDLGLTTAIPVQPPAPPMPPTPAPAAPPLSGGEFTMAFEQMKAAPAVTSTASASVPRESSAPRPMPVPPPPAPSAPAAASSEPLAIGGSAQPMAPPAGFVPRSRARGDEQSRAVEDARRLARLLVSEIKLYNEKKVEEGRSHLDLYQRLKDDIDRSRQVFEERTPEAIRKGNDFFHEELVRILADGRSEALGPMS